MKRILFSIFFSLLTSSSVVQVFANEPCISVCPAALGCSNNIYADFSEAVEQTRVNARSMIFVFVSYHHNSQLAEYLLHPEELVCANWANFASFVILQPNCACESRIPSNIRNFTDALTLTLANSDIDEESQQYLDTILSADQDKPTGVFMVTFALNETQEVVLLDIEKLDI